MNSNLRNFALWLIAVLLLLALFTFFHRREAARRDLRGRADVLIEFANS
jgi:hypothetical protein